MTPRYTDELTRATPTYRSPLDSTEREQDVTALVGKGMTNQEVAAELYISKKAVEYHVRNIFAKRGITSRRQLHPDIRYPDSPPLGPSTFGRP